MHVIPQLRINRAPMMLRSRSDVPSFVKRRRKSGCGFMTIGLIVALVLISAVAGFAVNRFNTATENIVQQDPRSTVPVTTTEESETLPEVLSVPFTVLLIGVDSREDVEEGARSDTLIVVYVNPQEGWASMLSIPRDSVTRIPHLGQSNKVNFAYTYGYVNAEELYGEKTDQNAAGGALAAETIENFLGLRIDYIAQVDFRGFEELIDLVGGITIDVSKPILDAEYPTENFGFERIYIPPGLQVMNGQTALRYARSRHSGTDFDRSRRQQQVLRAFLYEVQHRGLLEQVQLWPRFIESIEQHVGTTMPLGQPDILRGLARLAQNIRPDDVVQLSINPNDVAVIREVGSDIYWDQSDIEQLVTKLKLGPSAKKDSALIQVQNGTNIAGIATRVTTMLLQQGFELAEATDAPDMYAHTMIIDYQGEFPETRQQLAEILGIEDAYVYAAPPANAPPLPFNADMVVVLGQDYQE